MWLGLTDREVEGKRIWINGKQLKPRMLDSLNKGGEQSSRDYGHLMVKGGFLSRHISGIRPKQMNPYRSYEFVQGYIIEWPNYNEE